MRGQHRAIARQAEAQRLGEAIHRIGGEHATARAASRAGRAFDRGHFLVGIGFVGGHHHRVHQIERAAFALHHDLAGLHRAARDEDDGNVQPHRRHQHARRDLVAVRDADNGVGTMRVDHIFHTVGDEVAAGQRIEHAAVAHGDAIIHRDGVEFLGDAARRLDLAGDQLAQILQMHMARDKLGKAVGHRDDRLAEIRVRHAGGAPQPPRAGHVATVGGGS